MIDSINMNLLFFFWILLDWKFINIIVIRNINLEIWIIKIIIMIIEVLLIIIIKYVINEIKIIINKIIELDITIK